MLYWVYSDWCFLVILQKKFSIGVDLMVPDWINRKYSLSTHSKTKY